MISIYLCKFELGVELRESGLPLVTGRIACMRYNRAVDILTLVCEVLTKRLCFIVLPYWNSGGFTSSLYTFV